MQRNTRQRQVILEQLKQLKTHPTPAELYSIVRKRLPKISLGTIYRNLELLAGEKVIRKLDLGGAQSRFDADLDQHYHVRCQACNKVDDMPQTVDQQDLLKIAKQSFNGYEIFGHRLEFIGLCPPCAKRNKRGPAVKKKKTASLTTK